MAKILMIWYYFSRLYKLKLISYSKEQQVFNTYVIYLSVTKAAIFSKLSEIYFYWKISCNKCTPVSWLFYILLAKELQQLRS